PVGRVELAGGAAAPDVDAGVGEALADLLALVAAQRRLDAVLVGGAQLDGGKADALAHLEDGGHVPLLGDVVGDDAEAEPGGVGFALAGFGGGGVGGEPGGGEGAGGLQETAAVDGGHARDLRGDTATAKALIMPDGRRKDNSRKAAKAQRMPKKKRELASGLTLPSCLSVRLCGFAR